MKRILCLLLAILLIGLCGCSEKKEEAHQETTPTVPISFTEQVVLENEFCRFTVKSIAENPYYGYELVVQAENLSDLCLNFAIDRASINGCMVDSQYSQILSPDETLTESVVFSAEELDAYGITAATVIEFELNIYDEDTFDTVTLSQPVILYPRGEDAAQYDQRKAQKSDIVLLDNDICKVVVTGSNPESFWGYDLYIHIENKSDKVLLFSTQEASINDVFCDPFWTSTVAPGMRSCSTMYWFADDLQDAGIKKVEDITLLLSVADLDNWFNPMILEEVAFKP